MRLIIRSGIIEADIKDNVLKITGGYLEAEASNDMVERAKKNLEELARVTGMDKSKKKKFEGQDIDMLRPRTKMPI